ncbi:hypothetical protein SPI_02995 [Niveomyces insectorum RCEF 264]|uniref:HNH nuclease domain-containing protein n=1 Tax=Niveomyces insectorum RCEF 264 TaxID=1081102 RepID=A0A167WZE5_9HYPO|nr:hypothetical protein SPI_02995 [Niveomyces insectorum RCEF 264]
MQLRHRHQASLEGVIDFSIVTNLTETQHTDGQRRFYEIVSHFEALPGSTTPYSKPLLVRGLYDFAAPGQSKDNVLVVFFEAMRIPMVGNEALDYGSLKSDFDDFAEYMRENFLQPLKVAGYKTPLQSPRIDSALDRLQARHAEVGTPDRIDTLREDCLKRDRYRCVVTRAFDNREFRRRMEAGITTDDDGASFDLGPTLPRGLHVAHILPHALTKAESENNSELDETKKTTLKILNMFDSGVLSLIEGIEIDRPRNAMTMAPEMHEDFGGFSIFFEPVPGAPAHTYRVQHFLHPAVARVYGLPVTRTFFQHATTIDPPSPRLLAIHRAVAHILHMSGAGKYIDKLLDDLNKDYVRSDGSTRLGEMMALRMGGWWNGTVRG